mmetsp:Transcript_113380/g.315646  ORF Transcript_113380/g.315646 Transcript_113380/m.315646 type:complete len:305 (+) Transcript_113380:1617-2531(+)
MLRKSTGLYLRILRMTAGATSRKYVRGTRLQRASSHTSEGRNSSALFTATLAAQKASQLVTGLACALPLNAAAQKAVRGKMPGMVATSCSEVRSIVLWKLTSSTSALELASSPVSDHGLSARTSRQAMECSGRKATKCLSTTAKTSPAVCASLISWEMSSSCFPHRCRVCCPWLRRRARGHCRRGSSADCSAASASSASAPAAVRPTWPEAPRATATGCPAGRCGRSGGVARGGGGAVGHSTTPAASATASLTPYPSWPGASSAKATRREPLRPVNPGHGARLRGSLAPMQAPSQPEAVPDQMA